MNWGLEVYNYNIHVGINMKEKTKKKTKYFVFLTKRLEKFQKPISPSTAIISSETLINLLNLSLPCNLVHLLRFFVMLLEFRWRGKWEKGRYWFILGDYGCHLVMVTKSEEMKI